ncbi:conserved unknown protein [Ectocarpus siliculosus]|uniref:Uncharacterized protein n=1 Tax=Ectocarpus siliculosus TaxID=2880 RepID=D7FPI5_ECTSI|nr:conserved unknown protein [Ectocarpus siliculosus]|eukprot:CBJ30442.1 conserved unknown protein [Ectocarpus siliculosus]
MIEARIPLTTEGWTEDEHNGFLHGLEVYGYGNWDAIAVFVPSRSSPQIEAYAQQYVAQGESVHSPQVRLFDSVGEGVSL